MKGYKAFNKGLTCRGKHYQENMVYEEDGADYWRILHMCDINDTYKRLAEEHGATVVSLYDGFSSYCKENGIELSSLLCDGLHPNDEGYRVMYSLITDAFGV